MVNDLRTSQTGYIMNACVLIDRANDCDPQWPAAGQLPERGPEPAAVIQLLPHRGEAAQVGAPGHSMPVLTQEEA